jgi:starch-binding outer membrane protein SusE/F
MYLTADNDFIPQDGIVDMKFRENQDWTTNWGSSDFPAGIGILDGPNIPVTLNTNYGTTIYNISFNCRTGAYTFTDVSQ